MGLRLGEREENRREGIWEYKGLEMGWGFLLVGVGMMAGVGLGFIMVLGDRLVDCLLVFLMRWFVGGLLASCLVDWVSCVAGIRCEKVCEILIR